MARSNSPASLLQKSPSHQAPRRKHRVASIEGPDPVDLHVGARIRQHRMLLGMSQERLGEVIGLTFQQVQKYERGKNRVSASMLQRISNALDVPVSFFFDGMTEQQPPAAQPIHDMVARRESLELIRRYYTIPEPLRREVYALVKAMARAVRDTED